MNLSSYLHKRPGSQRWQLRWMVPKAARCALGKAEFTKSLGVTDRLEAERLAFGILASWQAEVDAVLGTAPASRAISLRPASQDELTSYVAEQTYKYQRSISSRIARASVLADESTIAEERQSLEGLLNRAREQLFLGTYDREVQFARSALAEHGLTLPDDAEVREWFARLCAQAAVDRFEGALAEMNGRGEDYAPSSSVKAGLARPRLTIVVDEQIMPLFEQYAAQRASEGNKGADTIAQDRKVLAGFSEFMGSRQSVREIAPADVRAWRDALFKLPRNFRKLATFKGLTLREAAYKADPKDNHPRLSALTINKYLSTLSPFLGWCWTEGYADRNACDGLFLLAKKGRNARPPFTAEQLNRILTSPLFTGFAADGNEHIPGLQKADDWRYWIPLACMFTGARISEIAQLSISDIAEQDGAPFLHIKHDEDQGKSTKSKVSRIAPVHSILVKIGFMKHVKRRAEQSLNLDELLFPELARNERGNIGAIPSRFWRDYLTAIEVKSGADGLGAHSFRHTIADQLRLADYLDNEIEVALGHNRKTVTSGYGRISQGTLARLTQMFEACTFEGVDFGHLMSK